MSPEEIISFGFSSCYFPKTHLKKKNATLDMYTLVSKERESLGLRLVSMAGIYQADPTVPAIF